MFLQYKFTKTFLDICLKKFCLSSFLMYCENNALIFLHLHYIIFYELLYINMYMYISF